MKARNVSEREELTAAREILGHKDGDGRTIELRVPASGSTRLFPGLQSEGPGELAERRVAHHEPRELEALQDLGVGGAYPSGFC